MSPKKILIISALAFLVLCAATLAYYLPKLRPQAEVSPGDVASSRQVESAPENRKPDINQELIKSIPVHPDDIVPPEQAAGPAPVQSATPQSATPGGPDSELTELLKSPPIQFEISSAKLTSPSKQYLNGLAAMLKEQPQIRLAIEGHTDSQDRLGKNQALSEDRAGAVLEYLSGKGVAAERLSSAGYGGSQPIAGNETAEGRAKNRRIEFEIRS